MGLPLEKNGELDRDEIPYSFFSGYDAFTLYGYLQKWFLTCMDRGGTLQVRYTVYIV